MIRMRTFRSMNICVDVAVLVAGASPAFAEHAAAGPNPFIKFTDAKQQAAEFIGYEHSIVLTPAQQRVMDAALGAIPAPCCGRYTLATCCCPCNLAKAAWGLSKLLITRHGADAARVKTTVNEWLQFTNSNGYTGDACFTGGCNRPFEKNGCGGMDEHNVQ